MAAERRTRFSNDEPVEMPDPLPVSAPTPATAPAAKVKVSEKIRQALEGAAAVPPPLGIAHPESWAMGRDSTLAHLAGWLVARAGALDQ